MQARLSKESSCASEVGYQIHTCPQGQGISGEVHDLDANEGWGRFSFAGSSSSNMKNFNSNCRNITSAVKVGSTSSPLIPSNTFWEMYSQKNFQKEGSPLYVCEQATQMYVAIDWKSSTAYFWH